MFVECTAKTGFPGFEFSGNATSWPKHPVTARSHATASRHSRKPQSPNRGPQLVAKRIASKEDDVGGNRALLIARNVHSGNPG